MTDFFYSSWNMFLNFLPNLIGAAVILVIGWWLADIIGKLVSKACRKSKIDEGIIGFLNSCITVIARVVIIISALSTLGLNMTSIIAALGAASVAAGLALKDSLSNFTSGILILFNKPFTVGDYLEVGGSCGTVDKIELMYTTLRMPDNKLVLFPNSHMTSSKIINSTSEPVRRLDITIPLANREDIKNAKEIIFNIAAENDKILAQPLPEAVVSSFDSKIIAQLWCATENYNTLCTSLYEDILNSFAGNNILIK